MADEFTPEEKLREVEREIALRMKLYPHWVAAGRISQDRAEKQLRILRAIARDYQERCL